jgi:predicted AAA+ superfamily ATPase
MNYTKYLPRILDKELSDMSKGNLAIAISGVKGCGKTSSAKRICKSQITIDNSSTMNALLLNNPDYVLNGEKPRLIDE